MIDESRDPEELSTEELIRKVGDEALRQVAKEFGYKPKEGHNNPIEDDLGSSESFPGHERFPDCPVCSNKWEQPPLGCAHVLLEYSFEEPQDILEFGPLPLGGVLDGFYLKNTMESINNIGTYFHSKKEIQEKLPNVLQGHKERVRDLVNEVISIISIDKESDGSLCTVIGDHIPAFHRYLTKIVSTAPGYLKSDQFGIEFVLGYTRYVVHWTDDIDSSGNFLKEELDVDISSLFDIEQAIAPPA